MKLWSQFSWLTCNPFRAWAYTRTLLKSILVLRVGPLLPRHGRQRLQPAALGHAPHPEGHLEVRQADALGETSSMSVARLHEQLEFNIAMWLKGGEQHYYRLRTGLHYALYL